MSKRLVWITGLVVATIFFAAGIYAGTTATDVIKMENKAYEKRTKGTVEFSHKKHVTDYKGACGDCHHDDQGKPLAELKEGDNVQSCIECHKKPGEKPKGKDAPKLSKKEELEFHAEAIHENCTACHKDYNKKNNTKAAPTTCTKCHPKTEKDK